ncbi:Hypothetical predicted protein [Olea europaea subsp. europaea]|uniref:Uncharacterized protein n=1 Tax=Olea europaea subsp. europaea TaxID=158383 RepID=A0A8S0QZM5_OLEEU|nr:Hypothetical predicted protein [Olea europaea subsp. europaea]
MIDEPLKKLIETEPISAIKIIEPEEVAEEKDGLLKRYDRAGARNAGSVAGLLCKCPNGHKEAELELVVEQLTSANKDLTTKVHLCRSEVNAPMKRVEISNNLQKISSTALEATNKKKAKLKAKVKELTTEVADLKL